MRDVYKALKEKGVTLSRPPAKGGVYTPVQELGKEFLYCSGCGPDLGSGNMVVDKLGKDLTVEDGQKTVHNCMLNPPADLSEKAGGLNRIKRFVKVLTFVNGADGSEMQLQAVNGGSNLIAGLFGEEVGFPAHPTIGTNALPGRIAYEVEVLVELK